ncbi:hypothetical protein [Phyllobacterium zundukense]|uniref:Uncharacterized protein n=1 Tax=Phyllobacterium zundukense TaxID=1867719 RepID=A0ACD4CVM6_9HYPH|nr:hypothetical protein [Phyllobacterium zundukense]UXN57616.1 hypothetical protein N8E88_01995 [Phyllobacterium zundukense]
MTHLYHRFPLYFGEYVVCKNPHSELPSSDMAPSPDADVICGTVAKDIKSLGRHAELLQNAEVIAFFRDPQHLLNCV